uniref:Ras association domain family member 2a n=1 Tax=Cyprinus carpio TaxID=7962 RepID=A0A8C2HI99_CYPCA
MNNSQISDVLWVFIGFDLFLSIFASWFQMGTSKELFISERSNANIVFSTYWGSVNRTPQMEVTPPEDQSSNGTTQDHEEEEEGTTCIQYDTLCEAVTCSASSCFVLMAEACDVSAQLLRTKSDAGVLRRGRRRSPSDQRRIRRHRFSINGHFYNHKTSVFTPAYGSVTNARINSCMTTPQVLRVLLNKFKIENSPDEFALYLVHASGERVQLKRTDYPLVVRILQGPCEHVCKIFLMEQDLGEEIPYEVAQYIKFEMPVLRSFIIKLKEEEDREVQKLRSSKKKKQTKNKKNIM